MAQRRGARGLALSVSSLLDGDCNKNLAKDFFIQSSPLFDSKRQRKSYKDLVASEINFIFSVSKVPWRYKSSPACCAFSKQNSTILQALNKKLKQTAEFLISSYCSYSALEFSLRTFSMFTSNSTQMSSHLTKNNL